MKVFSYFFLCTEVTIKCVVGEVVFHNLFQAKTQMLKYNDKSDNLVKRSVFKTDLKMLSKVT